MMKNVHQIFAKQKLNDLKYYNVWCWKLMALWQVEVDICVSSPGETYHL